MGSDSGSAGPTPAALERLGAALTGVRRAVAAAPKPNLDLPCAQHPVGLSKALACEAVAVFGHEHHGAAAAVKDVAALLSLEPSTASRLVGECEADGLLERRPHPTDGRRTSLHLTDLGREVVEQATAQRARYLAEILADWSAADITDLARLLELFASAWRDRRQGDPPSASAGG